MGINTAMYYGPEIILSAGFSTAGMDNKQAALLYTVPLAAVNAVGNIISFALIDKLGRRYLLLRTLPLIAVSWTLVAYGMYFNNSNDSTDTGTTIVFIGIFLFLLNHSVGMCSTPWTVNSEIYPLHVTGAANSVATTTNWMSNFFVATMFPYALSTKAG